MNAKLTLPESLTSSLIAPCGMNCGICLARLRDKNRCPGCVHTGPGTPRYCLACRIRNCDARPSDRQAFCFACAQFPCARLKRLDKRYRTKYGMSMIENLEHIRETGIAAFLSGEMVRWNCPQCGGLLCVHRDRCLHCGYVWK